MEQEVTIEHIGRFQDRLVTLKGWVYNTRSSGKIRFLMLRDGTGLVQCVFVKGSVPDAAFALCDTVTQESAVAVTGTVRKDDRAPGGYELTGTDLELVHLAEPYPVSLKEHGVDFLMKHRHLWIRAPRQVAILRIRSTVIKACRDYLDEQGFILCDTPVLTPAACEGTTTLFNVDYYGQPVFLTQSGQLYNEPLAAAVRKTYCFGPTFRAEKSKTRRHLTEFWMLEPEMAFCDLAGAMDLAEGLVCHVAARVLETRRPELEVLERDRSKLESIKKPFPRISYREAIELLNRKGKPAAFGDDFGGDEETVIGDSFDRPVLIHRYPTVNKAFYMKRDPQDHALAMAMDMIAPEGYGEIIGGGQREDDVAELEKRIEEHRLPREAFEWYLDVRRFGSFPHAGFGLGVERTVAWMCGVRHVRETIPFARMLEKVYP